MGNTNIGTFIYHLRKSTCSCKMCILVPKLHTGYTVLNLHASHIVNMLVTQFPYMLQNLQTNYKNTYQLHNLQSSFKIFILVLTYIPKLQKLTYQLQNLHSSYITYKLVTK